MKRLPSVLWAAGAILAVVGVGALLTLAVRAVVSAWWGWLLVPALLLVLVALRVEQRRVRRGTVLELDLDERIVEVDSPDRLRHRRRSPSGTSSMPSIGPREDSRVVALVARVGTGRIGPAQAEELRDAIRRFSAAGKKAIAWAETFGEGETALVPYYVATAFDEIWLQPSGELNVSGLVSRRPFLRRLLDRLSLDPRGRPPERVQVGGLPPHRGVGAGAGERGDRRPPRLVLRHDRRRASPSGGASAPTWSAASSTGPCSSPRRRGMRGSSTGSGIGTRCTRRSEPTSGASCTSSVTSPSGDVRTGGVLVIALVYGVGDVVRGAGTPVRSQLAADDVAAAIREAARSRRVRGIVVRIDSPGGSAVASDVVWRAIERARAGGIPVVASMGDVAASGGYWVATACDRIVADRMTVTGSIGVVFGKVVTTEAWRRLGVTWEESRRGARAGWLGPQEPWIGRRAPPRRRLPRHRVRRLQAPGGRLPQPPPRPGRGARPGEGVERGPTPTPAASSMCSAASTSPSG